MKNDGGPAFPQHQIHAPQSAAGHWENVCGMSLRDWLAGQALSALIARHRADVAWGEIAPRAYQIADAMLAERARMKD